MKNKKVKVDESKYEAKFCRMYGSIVKDGTKWVTHPMGIVCVLTEKATGKQVAKGIVLKSFKDNFDWKKYSNKAKGRAIAALTNQHNSRPIKRKEAVEVIKAIARNPYYHKLEERNVRAKKRIGELLNLSWDWPTHNIMHKSVFMGKRV